MPICNVDKFFFFFFLLVLLLLLLSSCSSSSTSFFLFFFFFWASCSNHCLAALDHQVLSSHSIVSSSRTVRPCSPWVGRWIGHWRTTWSTVCYSAPHSQAAEEAIPICTNMSGNARRWCEVGCRTHALLGRVIPGVWVPVSGMKMRSLVGLSVHSAFHWWSAQCAARMLLLSDELMNCYATVKMGVSIWGAVHLHSMDGWALSGADV